MGREVNDRDVGVLRRLFQALELECGGALTKFALERACSSSCMPVAAAARELHAQFDLLDIDASDAIDWTELVAAVLSASGRPNTSEGSSSSQPGSSQAKESKSGAAPVNLPVLRIHDDACWSAFDLLSQGGGVISSVSLGRLLAPSEVGPWLNRGSSESWLSSITGPEAARVAEFDRLVREVNPSGAVSSSEFISLLRGGESRPAQMYSPLPMAPAMPPPPLPPPAMPPPDPMGFP